MEKEKKRRRKNNEREMVWMESGRERCEETRDAWIEKKEGKNEEQRERGGMDGKW